ncbi:MAG: hypothetical protein KAT50_02285, partial [Pirellulales bacterium]|nr:hypothetical protein [Pirellulales bacterium]
LLITNQPLCQLSYASGPSGPRTEQVYGFAGNVQDRQWQELPPLKRSPPENCQDKIGFIWAFPTQDLVET